VRCVILKYFVETCSRNIDDFVNGTSIVDSVQNDLLTAVLFDRRKGQIGDKSGNVAAAGFAMLDVEYVN